MPYEEEIVGLLREIKEQQKEHYEEWRTAIADSKELQRQAAETARKAAKKALGVVFVIAGLIIVILVLNLSGTLFRIFTCGR